MGVVVQLVRIPACHAGGRGFESRPLRHCRRANESSPFLCAPGREHVREGGSPLLARQGEGLAERQGCRGRLRIRRKPKAKRWSEEQEADMRQRSGVRCRVSSKSETCKERYDVDPTGLSVKVGAQYPGRSACVPCATDIERCRDACAEVSRRRSRWGTKRSAREEL